MPNEDAKVVQPGCRHDNVRIVVETGADFQGQSLEPRLGPKFVDWSRLSLDVTGQNPNVISWHVTFVTPKSRAFSQKRQCGKTKCNRMVHYQNSFDTVAVTI